MNEINGLPAHILLIHLVVIGVPLAALLTVLSVVWPAAHRRLGVITPVIALLALVCVPITTHAGEWLQARVFHGYTNPLIVRHVQLGDELLLPAAGLFVAALLVWGLPVLWARRQGADGLRTDVGLMANLYVRIGVAVVVIALAGFNVVQVYRIGDAGAKAAWSSNFCPQPYVGDTCPTS